LKKRFACSSCSQLWTVLTPHASALWLDVPCLHTSYQSKYYFLVEHEISRPWKAHATSLAASAIGGHIALSCHARDRKKAAGRARLIRPPSTRVSRSLQCVILGAVDCDSSVVSLWLDTATAKGLCMNNTLLARGDVENHMKTKPNETRDRDRGCTFPNRWQCCNYSRTSLEQKSCNSAQYITSVITVAPQSSSR
jgi:hypothetical protein